RIAPKVIVNVPPSSVHPVRAVAVSPDKSTVAAGRGNEIHVYDAGSGTHVRTLIDPNLTTPDKKPVKAAHLSIVESLAFSPDGKLLASAGADNVIKVWTYETGEQARTIPAHGKQVTRLVFIGSTPQFATCSGDATVKFWNVDNGGNVRNFGGNNDYVYAVGVS